MSGDDNVNNFKRGLFLLLLAGIAGCTSVRTPARPATTLKVVTLNLYHDKDDWPKRRVQIAQQLVQLQPDVIALQEVIQRETLPNQAQWLAGQLGYQWHFVSVDPPGQAQRYGNAILTRRPILLRGEQRLRPFEDSRTVALLRINLDGRPVNIYATHLHHTEQGGELRQQQVADLMAYIAETSGDLPGIIAGDFNAAADSPELALLREDYVDTFGSQHPDMPAEAASTLNLAYFPPARIDHVFHQRDAFKPVASRLLFKQADAGGVWASDHYGVWVELALEPAAATP